MTKHKLPERAFILLNIVDVCNALRLYDSTRDERHLRSAQERLFSLYRKQLEVGGVASRISLDDFWCVNFMRGGQKQRGERGNELKSENLNSESAPLP